MTAHVNEYNPNSARATVGVETDPQKLKFNNVKSCIAIGLLPSRGNQLIGVHFTVISTQSDQELDGAMARMKALLAGDSCEAWMVAAWHQHATTNLVRKLKRVARRIWLVDVESNAANEANVDVKMEKSGTGQLLLSIREKALTRKDPTGQQIVKPKYAALPGNALPPGKSRYVSDRDEKPWMRVEAMRIHPR